MNEFEARMARIRERSSQMLLARKRTRRRILAACIPLLLCGMAAIFLLPDSNTTPVSVPQTATTVPITQNADSYFLLFETENGSKTVSDSETVREFAELLNGFYTLSQPETVTPGDDMVAQEDAETGTSGVKETLTIIITASNGEQNGYTLTDHILKCRENGDTVRLTDEQIGAIRRYIP